MGNQISRKLTVSKSLSFILIFIIMFSILTVALQFLFATNAVGGDFFIFWNAGKAIFQDKINPYNPAVTLRIQMGIYQHPAAPQQDQVAFAYPPYSLLILLPTFWMSYPWGEAFWLAFNLMLIVTTVFLIFPKAPKWLGFSYLLFYPVFLALIVGNFVVLIGTLLVIGFVWLLAADKVSSPIQIGLGIVLAWCTVKPQFSWLFIILFLIDAIHKKRWTFLISFGVSLGILLGISWLLVPTWVSDWIARLTIYSDYVKVQTTTFGFLQLFLSSIGTWIVMIILGILSGWITIAWLIQWWRGKRSALDIFLWAGFVIYLFHPPAVTYEQISLFAPMLCWAALHSKKPSFPWIHFWLLFIPVTWLAFYLGQSILVEFERIPMGFFTLFLIWYYVKEKKIFLPLERIKQSTKINPS